MIKELQDIFPKLTETQIFRILITIKSRYKKYGSIGISRLEASRFGTSERQMYSFIKYIRNIGAINKIKMATATNGFKCNVYSVSKWFISLLNELKDYVKKAFKYIKPLEFVKNKFTYKTKGSKLKFKVNGNKYIIDKRGRFKDKIYGIEENKIINPYNLI